MLIVFITRWTLSTGASDGWKHHWFPLVRGCRIAPKEAHELAGQCIITEISEITRVEEEFCYVGI